MNKFLLSVCGLMLAIALKTQAQVPLQTSFENSEGYLQGNLHNQNNWKVTAGNAVVSAANAKTGAQDLSLSADNTALQVDFIPYSGSVAGLTGDVYTDLWINPSSFLVKGISINGYDLFGNSAKRIFVIEFTTDNNIRAYNGSAASTIGTWTSNQWVRISIKADIATEKYKIAINGTVSPTEFNFRESYTPTASGDRVAGVKQFHSLRFNHTSDSQIATSSFLIDDVYIGTNPIYDVSFSGAANSRTVTVNQPDYGTITLSPAAPYELNQQITATLTVPEGYKNNGWTGNLSGTELVKNFTVTGNMTIGAATEIDSANPPPQFVIHVNQPENGTITLSPAATDNKYYKETKVTATLSFEFCNQFNGWTGDLSGQQATQLITVAGDMTIGADLGEITGPVMKRRVTNADEFKAALNAANPGDSIIVEDGTYNLSALTISRSGCVYRPIVITAKNLGKAILNGNTALTLESLKYVTIKGFSFQSVSIGTGIKLQNCSRVRITENAFAIKETSSCNWIYVGDTFASPLPLRSGHNLIDHNSFDGKTQSGKYIVMDGNINQQSQHDTISYNLFKNNGPRAANEKETIRVGVSPLSKSSGFTVIEYNLFQDCDGDPEIVSIKSCDNIVRYNTFQRCLGTVCLRQGSRSVVEGNYFFGEGKTAIFTDPDSGVDGVIGCGGVRTYGIDHKVLNNYFTGLTGFKFDAAITLTNGDVTNSSTSLADHYLPENISIAFNTFVNNYSNIEIGFDHQGGYPKFPVNCLIANNVVVDNSNPIVKSYSDAALAGVTFSNNIMYPTGTSSIGISVASDQIKVADPMLIQPLCKDLGGSCKDTQAYKVFRLGQGSPAINAATGNFSDAALDFEKQTRTGVKDIGADEYQGNNPIAISALGPENVGPGSVPFAYAVAYEEIPANQSPALDDITPQAVCSTSKENTIALTGISAGGETNQTTSVSVSADQPSWFNSLSVAMTGNSTGELKYSLKENVAGTATITVTVKDNGGTENGGTDTYSGSFTLTVNPLPVVTIHSDHPDGISKGEAANLIAAGGTSYVWQDASGITGSKNNAVLKVMPTETTTYRVTVLNENACATEGEITVTVKDNLSALDASNIITPDGDGVNDLWIVKNINLYPNNEVKIFDRAGRLIYSKKGYHNDWNGTLNGRYLSEDTYYYVVDTGTPQKKLKGFITILRNN